MSSLKSPKENLSYLLDANLLKLKRSPRTNLIMGMLGGSFIAIAGLFYIIATSGETEMFYGAKKFMGAIAFTTGFVLVLTASADLYTSNAMMITNVMQKTMSPSQLLKNLSFVFIANFIGALIFLAIIILGKVHLQGGGKLVYAILSTGSAKMSHSFFQAFVLGIGCNFLVCLAYWASCASSTAGDKIITLTLPIAAFVVAGFEHSVANMFLIPLALFTKATLPAELSSYLSAYDFSAINLTNAIVYNFIPVTLGNFVGGAIFVGLPYTLAFSDGKK